MEKVYILLISILLGGTSFAASDDGYPFQDEFEAAYEAYPSIPKGVLEAVAWSQTRFVHIAGNNHSCTGLPEVKGVMGLTENGEGYFKDNMQIVSNISGYSIHELKTDPAKNIMGYAAAYQWYFDTNGLDDSWQSHERVLEELSEIPLDDNMTNRFALQSFTYQIFRFLNNPARQSTYNMPIRSIDLIDLYGPDNHAILSSAKVNVSAEVVSDDAGHVFISDDRSLEYGPALWVATPACNYSSRAGTPISAVTIHTIQGTYAGAISWAQNCEANVSYHYVARSSDGQITQMLYEADKGWHVGSENPYTIGIEHEGYVTVAAWYTEAMYVGSANLVKDITESGYGINPLRTFQGPATAGTNVLGSCIRIKGHQHYPYQTHTDPGINWNWEHYYQLINGDPSTTVYTSPSGTLFDSGGSGGNYSNDERELYLIQPVAAVDITISFEEFSLETDWDYLRVYDGATLEDPLLGVFTGTDVPATLSSTGGSILIEFRSDCATTGSGWKINWGSVPGPVPGDVISPSTVVSLGADWYTEDFDAEFLDNDDTAGTGVKHRFYQVIDWDGTEWRANSDHGFFSDNFDAAIHPEWTSETGTWSISSGKILQSDETLDNTNIWANLNQDDDDIWLYHFGINIDGAELNKRAGLHFMCDDPTLTNRGNSYFVWFRSDNDKIQIYKTVADVFTLEADIPFIFDDGVWYDVKTIYDKTNGAIEVWINDEYEAAWVDTDPYLTGNAISLRTGNSSTRFENLKVYHNRSTPEMITIGGPAAEVRYQNPNPLTPSCKVKSIVVDSSANISFIAADFANIDWTPPVSLPYVNDGVGADIATTGTNTELSANWPATADPNSDVTGYWYSIGTSPGAADIVDWTDNWYDTTVTHTGLSLIDGTTYYVCVFAENGAGLHSDTVCSDGQTLVLPSDPPDAYFVVYGTNVCQPDSIQFENASSDATTYSWSVPGATPSSSTDVNPYFFFPVSGTYEVTLTATGPGGTDVYVQSILVESYGQPLADFDQSDVSTPITDPFITFTNNSLNADGYYWSFGDGGTSTDYEPWHEYTAVGVYEIMLIAINGTCPNDTMWSTVEITEPLDITEEDGLDFSIQPNPASEYIQINLNEAWNSQTFEIVILDNQGKLVYRNGYKEGQNQLIIPIDKSWSNGLYILKVLGDNSTRYQKFVVNTLD